MRPPGQPLTEAVELNLDGLPGPTHNFGGLARGNLASMEHGLQPSNPRRAVLQCLEKMRLVAGLGALQGVLPPQERPDFALLRRLGLTGDEGAILERAQREAPRLLAAAYSAAPMWTANAATISPSPDTADGRLHLTPANLASQLHRSVEAAATARVLRKVFADPAVFALHQPLPACDALGDEGAANHLRLCAAHGAPGVEVFVYGRQALYGAGRGQRPTLQRFPARQTREASEAVARLHGLAPERIVLVQQDPRAIDAGAFHNDVVCMGNGPLLVFHEAAFAEPGVAVALGRACREGAGFEAQLVEVSERRIPLATAVETYLFNSQIVDLPGEGGMALVAPAECQGDPAVRAWVEEELVGADRPVRRAEYVDLDQSLRNGGGPACLRLRVVLTAGQRERVHPGVLLDAARLDRLTAWVERHYRERLVPADLVDPQLVRESRQALDELTAILDLGSIYAFQGCGPDAGS